MIATTESDDHPLAALYRRPGFLIRRAHQIATLVFAEHCQPLGFTTTQFGLMITLDRYPGLDQVSAGRLVHLDRSTTGLVLGLLDKRGLLHRQQDLSDRRKHMLHVTERGRQALAAVTPAAEQARRALLAGFSDLEAHILTSLLQRLCERYDGPSDPAVAQRLELLYRRPGFLIRRAHQLTTQIFAEQCQPFGITTTQFGLMMALKRFPGVDQITAGQLVRFDRSTTGLVIALLEKRGHLHRSADPDDRRRRVLHLTDAGAAVLAAAMPAAERARDLLLTEFSDLEAEMLLKLLGRLIAHHDDQPPPTDNAAYSAIASRRAKSSAGIGRPSR